MERLTIYADKGEERSGIPGLLQGFGVEVALTNLGVGDYILSDRVCVEQKTAVDFVNAIRTKRLFKQAVELRQAYERPLLLVEGYELYQVKGVSREGIRGALAMIVVASGMPVLFSKDKGDTAQFLLTIARQEQLLGRLPTIYYKPKAPTPSAEVERILYSFPGVGPVTGAHLLERYQSLSEILSASVEELKQVPGIGEKRARRLKETLEHRYRRPDRTGS